MLDSIKRLFSRPEAVRDLNDVSDWAKRRGHAFRRVQGNDGFVIEGMLENAPWRMEWGPTQRPYIPRHELRMRMGLNLSHDMQMLVMSRPLMDTLERETFEEFTDNVQTQVGTKTPEEMRWLVMYTKVNLSTMKALRPNFGAVSNLPEAAMLWLEGPFASALEQAATDFLRDKPPFVLMTLRGRLYLRMLLTEPDPKPMYAALALFETAVTQALRAATGMSDKLARLEAELDQHPQTPLPWSPNATDWQTLPPSDLPDKTGKS
jgi:hypothetical protein